MPVAPQTWHYGLVARWWAEFNVASADELAYYTASIERYGQPALDLGCGTGRILLPLARAGLDVDGCDVSADMLAFCRERAARDGLAVRLHAQSGHELDLPRKYGTIYICDSFGIVGDAETLRRCHLHLLPGGALIFNVSLPYKNADWGRYWLAGERRALPQPWPGSGTRKTAANGDAIELRTRLVDFDPLEQQATTQMQAILWRDGTAVMQEEHTLRQTVYFRNEILLMLVQAGFEDISVTGRDGRPLGADDVDAFFIARRPQ